MQDGVNIRRLKLGQVYSKCAPAPIDRRQRVSEQERLWSLVLRGLGTGARSMLLLVAEGACCASGVAAPRHMLYMLYMWLCAASFAGLSLLIIQCLASLSSQPS